MDKSDIGSVINTVSSTLSAAERYKKIKENALNRAKSITAANVVRENGIMIDVEETKATSNEMKIGDPPVVSNNGLATPLNNNLNIESKVQESETSETLKISVKTVLESLQILPINVKNDPPLEEVKEKEKMKTNEIIKHNVKSKEMTDISTKEIIIEKLESEIKINKIVNESKGKSNSVIPEMDSLNDEMKGKGKTQEIIMKDDIEKGEVINNDKSTEIINNNKSTEIINNTNTEIINNTNTDIINNNKSTEVISDNKISENKILEDEKLLDEVNCALFDASRDGDLSKLRSAHENGGQLNYTEKGGKLDSVLFVACRNGHFPIVEYLIQQNVKIQVPKKDGTTPIFIACQNNHLSIAELLIKNGADIHISRQDGCDCLFVASQIGNESVIEYLLQQGSMVNKRANDGTTALCIAVYKGHVGCAKILLSYDALDDIPDNDGKFPYDYLANKGEYAKLKALAAQAKSKRLADEVALKNNVGAFNAARDGKLVELKSLVDNGAEINWSNPEYNNDYILFAACRNGHFKIVEYLIDQNVNINAVKESNGSTSLLVASQCNHAEVVSLLIKNHANIDAKLENGASSLYLACQENNFEVVKLLIENGGNINDALLSGGNCLSVATEKNHLEIVELLLKNGVNVNETQDDGTTALDIALHRGHKDCVSILITYGATLADLSTYENIGISLDVLKELQFQGLVARKIMLDSLDAKERLSILGKALFSAACDGMVNELEKIIDDGAPLDYIQDASPNDSVMFVACRNGHVDVVKVLVKHGIDPNAKKGNGASNFYIACQNGHVELIKYFMEKNINIEENGFNDTPCLYIASQMGHLSIVELILSCGLPVDTSRKDGCTSLFAAVLHGHAQVVKLLLSKGADFEKFFFHGTNSLIIACQKGYTEVVRVLLEIGADVTKTDELGHNAMFHVCAGSGSVEILKLLLEYGATLDFIEKETGYTLLHAAAEVGHTDAVDFLLTNELEIDGEDFQGSTALHVAFDYEQISTAAMLLSHGAVESQRKDGKFPLDCNENITKEIYFQIKQESIELMEKYEKEEIERCNALSEELFTAGSLGNLEKVQNLHEDGGHFNFMEKGGRKDTVLFAACRNGHVKIVEYLIDQNVNINAVKESNGSTSLLVASQCNHAEVVSLLIKNHANIDAKLENGASSLYLACQENNFEVVKLLIENGGNVNDALLSGGNCLSVATEKNHLEIVELLLKNGVNVNETQDDGTTALDIALHRGHKECVISLLSYGGDAAVLHSTDKNLISLFAINIYSADFEEINRKGQEIRVRVEQELKIKAEKQRIKNVNLNLMAACKEGKDEIVLELLKEGGDYNYTEEGGKEDTCSFAVCRYGHVRILEILVSHGANLFVSKLNGVTLLYIAAQEGRIKILEYLIKQKLDIKKTRNDGMSALHIAIQNNHLNVVKILFENGADIGACDSNGYSPLHMSCIFSRIDIVSFLLKKGANTEQVALNGNTPMDICMIKGSRACILLLLEYNAKAPVVFTEMISNSIFENLNDQTVALRKKKAEEERRIKEMEERHKLSIRALSFAREGKLDEFSKLVDEDVDVEQWFSQDEFMDNAIFSACRNGHLNIVEYMHNIGFDIHSTKDNGASLLYIACQCGHYQLVEYLLSKNVDVELPFEDGSTALFIASQNNYIAIVKLLIKNGANIESSNDKLCTSLYIACLRGNIEIFRFLVSNNAYIHCTRDTGATPLYAACSNNHVEIAEELILKGSDINLPRSGGFTPLHAAVDFGHSKCVILLLSYGAMELKSDDGLFPYSYNDRMSSLNYYKMKKEAELIKNRRNGVIVLEEGVEKKIENEIYSWLKSIKGISEFDLQEYTNKLIADGFEVVDAIIIAGKDFNIDAYVKKPGHKILINAKLKEEESQRRKTFLT